MNALVVVLLVMIVALFVWGQIEKNRLLGWFAMQQQQWIAERSELLDRIKPETAPFKPNVQTVPEIRSFDFEDDEQYQRVMQASKEDLAALVEAGEL